MHEVFAPFADVKDFEAVAVFAVFALLISAVLLLFGFVLSAKGGVISNLINDILMMTMNLVCVITLSDAHSKLKDTYGSIYTNSNTYNGYIGVIVFVVATFVFSVISLILSFIGLSKKKNY